MSSSLNTIGEIKDEFLVRGQVSTTAAFYSDAILNSWIDQGHKWASGYKKWPFGEGRVSTTYASLVTDEDGLLAGEYPEGWKPDSIRMLRIGGKAFQKTQFYQFTKFFEDNPESDKKLFSDYGRRYYVNASAGSGTVVVWGQFTPSLDLTDTSATTVFSSAAEEANGAIVDYMLYLSKIREKDLKTAVGHLQVARATLDALWDSVKNEQYGYQGVDGEGMFKRIDVLGGALRDDLFKRDQFY